jgi:chaperonin GroES
MALDPGMQAMNPGGMMGGAINSDMPEAQPSINQLSPEPKTEDSYDDDANPFENLLDYALSQANLAKNVLKKEDGQAILDQMGDKIYTGYMDDENSRKDWMKSNEEWMKLALLTRENKTFPWPRAANVKYPLIATAAMQFSARAYPALVPQDGNLVKAKVSAVDEQGNLEKAAIRVGKHMSYQILCKMPCWEEEMDKLLMTIAVSGICFKKTFHNAQLNCHYSQLVYPEHLCINYWAKSLDKAYRKTEILHYTQNEYEEKVADDQHFLDIELESADASQVADPKIRVTTNDDPSKSDEATPHVFLSCHTFWDLDEDGYEEPYIITIHKDTKKVVRILARWDSNGVYKDDKGKVIRIVPVEYFTDFPFIPNPDGSIYALGFGMLLGPMNEAVNTITNQLIDAGTMANLQAGFIGRNLRIKGGQVQFTPNEWKVVNASGDELQKSIYPLPTKEPSTVLFQLLNLLISSGNQLASIAEIFVGKNPGQNTKATTTQEMVTQGMAVFTAIYKRVYRSLQKEFKKIFRLNRITPGIVEEESEIVGQLQKSDYEGTEHLIIPGADPAGDSSSLRMQKLQQVGQLLAMGTINQMVFTQRMLESLEIPNYQELIAQPQPPAPDPKIETEKMKQQTMQQKAQIDAQAKVQEIESKERLMKIEAAMKAMELRHKQQMDALELNNTRQQADLDLVLQTTKAQQEVATGEMKAEHEGAMMERQMVQEKQLHEQKMKQTAAAAKQKQAVKPKAKTKK